MLGEETHDSDGAFAAEGRDWRAALAEACRGVRQRLEAVAADLGTLRLEIERALGEELVDPSTQATPPATE